MKYLYWRLSGDIIKYSRSISRVSRLNGESTDFPRTVSVLDIRQHSGFFEHGREHFGFVKRGGFLERRVDC